MKKILLFLLLPLLFACEPEPVLKGRQVYKAYFQKKLVDPESFKVYSEKYDVDGVTVKWKLDYGAKNRMGAMTREEVDFTTIGSTIWIGGWSYEL